MSSGRKSGLAAGVLSAALGAVNPAAADRAIIHGNYEVPSVVVPNITTEACLGLAEDKVRFGQAWSAGVTCLGEDGQVTGKRACSNKYVPDPDAKWWSASDKKIEIRCE